MEIKPGINPSLAEAIEAHPELSIRPDRKQPERFSIVESRAGANRDSYYEVEPGKTYKTRERAKLTLNALVMRWTLLCPGCNKNVIGLGRTALVLENKPCLVCSCGIAVYLPTLERPQSIIQ